MARIAGVDLPPNKRLEVALTYIHGIARTRSLRILSRSGVDKELKVNQLSEDQLSRIRQTIEDEGGVMGDVQKAMQMSIKRLMEIGAYRGLRHRRGLPVRGQRTHTNARTRKGKRKGAVAGKKKATKT